MAILGSTVVAIRTCACAAGGSGRSGRRGNRAIACAAALFLSCAVGPAWLLAVPASPEPWKTSQPDGTQITLRLKGDERFHWHEDASGYPVLKDAATGRWVYAAEGATGLAATAYVVGKTDPAAVGLAKARMDRVRASGSPRSLAPAADTGSHRVPAAGTLKNLVVLVNFSDLAITNTTTEFNNLFNQIGYTTDGASGSVKDYYLEVSRNALTVQSVIGGPVTVSQGYAYYGGNDSWGNDLHPREMVQEALALLEASGFDFRTVDGDGDGWVDGLTIIHAGGGEEYGGNDTNYIWSHAWAMPSTVIYDGIRMWQYHTEPARRGWDGYPSTQGITRIGVICHETGHFLGLPDLYDTDYSSEGVGNFCLMAGGSWNGDSGSRPAHASAWCKAELGWVAPVVLSGAGSYTASAVESGGQVYRVQGVAPSGQYYLLENRQGVGFDIGLPGTQRGILIWHINDNKYSNDDESKIGGEAQYLVDLEEAGATQHLELNQNAGDDADYFRTGTMANFTSGTNPANISGLNITGIGATGSAMSFAISTTAIAPTVTTTPPVGTSSTSAASGGNVTSDGLATVTARGVCWSTVANPTIADSHTTDGGGTGIFVSTITGLTPFTLYHVRAYATNSAGTGYGEDLTVTPTNISTYLNETFESTFVNGAPAGWSKAFQTGTVDWQQSIGDYGSSDTAHGGTYNAMLFYSSTSSRQTYLITPQMNLAGVTNASLEFWHKQAYWSPDQDTLTVYYKTSAGGTWTQLATYTSNISSWTKQTISLPNPSATYYIGFLGTAKYGWGVCIDDVVVSGQPGGTAPTVTTTSAGIIACTTAISGGNVTSDGGAAVTARGVCWSTLANPTIAGMHTTDGSSTGSFTSSITGLTPSTLYHVRAYATNGTDTGYGEDLTFTTHRTGDVDGDGLVDVLDLLSLVDAFGSGTGDTNYDPQADFNGDGYVDVADLLDLVNYFGT